MESLATNDIIGTMATSSDNLQPLTSEQAVRLRHDLILVEERLQDIAILMRVATAKRATWLLGPLKL
jgi:hypothetical protein